MINLVEMDGNVTVTARRVQVLAKAYREHAEKVNAEIDNSATVKAHKRELKKLEDAAKDARAAFIAAQKALDSISVYTNNFHRDNLKRSFEAASRALMKAENDEARYSFSHHPATPKRLEVNPLSALLDLALFGDMLSIKVGSAHYNALVKVIRALEKDNP